MLTLKEREEFLAVARGGRVHKTSFTLQFQSQQKTSGRAEADARFGLTVTKKTGNAVVRNRIKRRLRAALLQQEQADTGTDYVLIARLPALTLPFEALVNDLNSALVTSKKQQ